MFVAGRAAAALAAALLLQGGPASAGLLNLPSDVQARSLCQCTLQRLLSSKPALRNSKWAAQAKIEQAPHKVPSVAQLAQGNAPTTPSRDFTPPEPLDEQLGSAQVSCPSPYRAHC